MTVLLLLIMDYRFTGNAFHEIGGVVFALLFVFHNVLNRRWYEVFFKGRQSLRRVLTTLVNLFLVVTMVTVFVTGALISVTVFAPLDMRSENLFMHDMHQGAAFVSFILIAIHLGMHWEILMSKLKNWLHIDVSSLGWVFMSRIISSVVIIYGIYASFTNDIGEKLLMQRVFMGWGEEPSLWGFLLDHFAIVGSYVGITHILLGLLRRVKDTNPK
ncbi:DUF4405 domain-containing protein [Sporomusa malonica]|nr:DUF4405 domain-containing protein [Sporomusa malonica]